MKRHKFAKPPIIYSFELTEPTDSRFEALIDQHPAEPSWQWEYYIKDHLGNIRLTFSDVNNDGQINVSLDHDNEILEEFHYYPFGMKLGGPWLYRKNLGFTNRYNYNGKEEMPHTGYLYYGARVYDPSVGRFGGVDPLADEMPGWSPFNYTFNNPIRFIDPDGRMPMPGGPDDPPKKVPWDQRVRNQIGKAIYSTRDALVSAGNYMSSLFSGESEASDGSEYTTPGGMTGYSQSGGGNEENHHAEISLSNFDADGILDLTRGMTPGKSKTSILKASKHLKPGNLKEAIGGVKKFDQFVSFVKKAETIKERSASAPEKSEPGIDTMVVDGRSIERTRYNRKEGHTQTDRIIEKSSN